MRVLITGAAGFIGSHLAQRLLDRGDTVFGIDNFNDYYNPARKRKNIEPLLKHTNFKMIEGDIRDLRLVNKLVSDLEPEGAVHLAAMAGVRNSVSNPSLYTDVNIVGSQLLMDQLRGLSQFKNFVFASTSSIYGGDSDIPFKEHASCHRPLQPYAATKRSVELLGYCYNLLYGFNFTATRFFTVYGPKGRPDMMPMKLARSIWNKEEIPFYGEQMARDWTYVGDIVDGLVLALDKPLGYEILNLGRGNPSPLVEFIAEIERIAGSKAILKPEEKPLADVYRTYADSSKAKQLIGYEPKISISEGVKLFWEWFKEDGYLL